MATEPVIYKMVRNGAVVAHAAVLPNGKCIVSWPTSTIVYDSEPAARAVHISHMGGRGERTSLVPMIASAAFWRGYQDCYQDRCEGIPDATGPKPPHYIPEADRQGYEAGYWAMSREMYGEGYQPDESNWQGDRAKGAADGA